MLFGQSYAFQHNSAYVPGSGAEDTWSDYVGRVTVSPGSWPRCCPRSRSRPGCWR